MESKKDEDIVRFSDLIKKGAAGKKDEDEKEETSEVEKKSDEGPLRFSDLDALKLRSGLGGRGGAAPRESAFRSGKERPGEGVAGPSKDAVLNDLEAYKKFKAKERQKAPPIPAGEERDTVQAGKEEKIRSSEMAMPVKKGPEKGADLKDAASATPPAEERRAPEKPETAVAAQAPSDIRKLYEEVRYCLEWIKGKVISGQPFEIQEARKVVEKMIESRQRIEDLYPLTTKTIDEEDYNISHQTNVAIYALKLGFGLGYSREKLLELGLCSLLHDTGMFRIPEGIRLKREKLTGQEVDTIKTHTDIGRDILNAFSGSHPTLPVVAYQHHEREGGQGYPRGLQGSDIHEYARIVAITDSYEAMTHHRPYRRALLQPLSAKELIKQKNALFAPFVIKMFLQEISLYPPGSYVLLNNKAVAEVIANDKNHPLRPDVRILYDGEGNRVEGDVVVKLAQNPLFFIVDGVSQDEIPGRTSK